MQPLSFDQKSTASNLKSLSLLLETTEREAFERCGHIAGLATFRFLPCILYDVDTDVKGKGAPKSVWFLSEKQCLPLPLSFPPYGWL